MDGVKICYILISTHIQNFQLWPGNFPNTSDRSQSIMVQFYQMKMRHPYLADLLHRFNIIFSQSQILQIGKSNMINIFQNTFSFIACYIMSNKPKFNPPTSHSFVVSTFKIFLASFHFPRTIFISSYSNEW